MSSAKINTKYIMNMESSNPNHQITPMFKYVILFSSAFFVSKNVANKCLSINIIGNFSKTIKNY